MAGLFDQLARPLTLHRAWDRVEANAGGPGSDGMSVEEFGLAVDASLDALSGDLLSGAYRPRPLHVLRIAKKAGGQRTLRVPTVRDRIAQTAAAIVLNPVIERELEDCSFGYRQGRSVEDAIARIVSLRDAGYQWLLEADIDDFFDTVDHALVLARLASLVQEPQLIDLVRLWVACDECDRGLTTPRLAGLPQGSPLSPLLANLYLDRFDEAIQARGHKLVRFADDFVVLCRSREEAEQALELTRDVMAELSLALDPAKSGISSFSQGIQYLGALFGQFTVTRAPKRAAHIASTPEPDPVKPLQVSEAPALPAPSTGSPAEGGSPDDEEDDTELDPVVGGATNDHFLRTLYIQRWGAMLRLEGDAFRVTVGPETLVRLPVRSIDQVVVFGHVLLSSHAMARCLEERKPVYFLSSRGRYYGMLVSTFGENATMHRAQFEFAADSARRLRLARLIIAARLRSAAVLLRRNLRRHPDAALRSAVERVQAAEARALAAMDLDQLRGFEGEGTRVYYEGMRRLLPEELGFRARIRRPPPDPINSLLGFVSSIVYYNVFSMLSSRGLHPFVGMIHEAKAGHASLASDLVEEFRAPVIESLVLRMVATRLVTKADFTFEGRGCFLTAEGRAKVLPAIERKLATRVKHDATGYHVSYRRCMDLQVQALRRAILGEVAEYRPMGIR